MNRNLKVTRLATVAFFLFSHLLCFCKQQEVPEDIPDVAVSPEQILDKKFGNPIFDPLRSPQALAPVEKKSEHAVPGEGKIEHIEKEAAAETTAADDKEN